MINLYSLSALTYLVDPPLVAPRSCALRSIQRIFIDAHHGEFVQCVSPIGLLGTQIYSCMRYGLFPNNPISIITSSPSFSLEKTLTGH